MFGLIVADVILDCDEADLTTVARAKAGEFGMRVRITVVDDEDSALSTGDQITCHISRSRNGLCGIICIDS